MLNAFDRLAITLEITPGIKDNLECGYVHKKSHWINKL